MNIKEQESQLAFTLRFEIVISVVLWLAMVVFVTYRLWMRSLPQTQTLTIMNNVPGIKQSNIDTLRSSLKPVVRNNLPVIRIEPFD